MFTGRTERARAAGVWGAVIGVSMAVGPMLGGVFIDSFGWRSVFWVNHPVCLVAFVLTTIRVPESKSSRRQRFNPVGQLLGVVLVGAMMFG